MWWFWKWEPHIKVTFLTKTNCSVYACPCLYLHHGKRPQRNHFAVKACRQPFVWAGPTVRSLSVSCRGVTIHTKHLKLLLFLTVTSSLWVWPSTWLPPPCCWPCTRTPPSQKASDQPEPESRVRLRVAPWSLCTIWTTASYPEATARPAAGSLEWKQYHISHLNQGNKILTGYWNWIFRG